MEMGRTLCSVYGMCRGKCIFRDASEISHETFRLGTGDGILSTYRGFEKDGKLVSYEFQTLVWVEDATGMCAVNGFLFRKKDWT